MQSPVCAIPATSPSSNGFDVGTANSIKRSPSSWKLENISKHQFNQEQHNKIFYQKPPRHSNVPMCAQILSKLWKSVLKRNDICITSDFFCDLEGSEEQAASLVKGMQQMGFNISLEQFFSMYQCSIYTILIVAL
jgi:hypothetical protein